MDLNYLQNDICSSLCIDKTVIFVSREMRPIILGNFLLIWTMCDELGTEIMCVQENGDPHF